MSILSLFAYYFFNDSPYFFNYASYNIFSYIPYLLICFLYLSFSPVFLKSLLVFLVSSRCQRVTCYVRSGQVRSGRLSFHPLLKNFIVLSPSPPPDMRRYAPVWSYAYVVVRRPSQQVRVVTRDLAIRLGVRSRWEAGSAGHLGHYNPPPPRPLLTPSHSSSGLPRAW